MLKMNHVIKSQANYKCEIQNKKVEGDIFFSDCYVDNQYLTCFNNQLWRSLGKDICKKTWPDVDISIISPFGFEVLEKNIFLSKYLRRFYYYIAVPEDSGLDPEEVSTIFLAKLLYYLDESNTKLFQDILLIVKQEEFTDLTNTKKDWDAETAKLIDVQCRLTNRDILSEYADYVIACLDSISNKKGEAISYLSNKRFRSRIYQLYIMLEKIFAKFLPALDLSQRIFLKNIVKWVDNRVDMFLDDTKLFITIEEEEIAIFNELIEPRIQLIKDSVIDKQNPQNNVDIDIVGFHVSDRLNLSVRKDIYNYAVQHIKQSYLNYG